MLENAVGRHLTGDAVNPSQPATGFQVWLYRFALERGHLDSVLNDWVVRPFTAVFTRCNQWEHRWTNFLGGEPSGETSKRSSGFAQSDKTASKQSVALEQEQG